MGYGIGQAIGGFASGLASGMKTVSDLEDAKQRRALAQKQSEREDERFKMEKEKMDDERAKIAARKEFAAQIAQIQADATSGKNGFEQFGFTAQQTTPNPVAAGAISGPDGQPGRSDIAGPPTAPVQQQQSAGNIFKATADGLYSNQRGADQLIAQRRAQALEEMYTKLGEPEKAMMAKSQMADLFDKDVERKTKTALAAAAIGAPGAMDAFAKVYHYFNDGKDINPQSGRFDPETGSWKGVEFRDNATGRVQTMDITQGMILGLAKQDVTALVPFNIEQAWKAKEFSLKARDTTSKEKSADADVTRAGAAVTSAGADVTRAGAAVTSAKAAMMNANTNAEKVTADAKGADQKAKVEAITKMFPRAAMKPADMMMLTKEEKAAAKNEQLMAEDTIALSAVNPKLDVRILADVARQGAKGALPAQRDSDGKPYVMVGSTKVYLP